MSSWLESQIPSVRAGRHSRRVPNALLDDEGNKEAPEVLSPWPQRWEICHQDRRLRVGRYLLRQRADSMELLGGNVMLSKRSVRGSAHSIRSTTDIR
jgi:hypothetical protein